MATDREISVRLEGPTTSLHRVPLDDYLRVGRHLQIAIKRAGLAVGGARAHPVGRLPKDIELACSLEVGLPREGSFEAPFYLPEPPPSLQLFGDIGMIAARQVVDATQRVMEGHGWPPEVGLDVRSEIGELARVLDHGITSVGLRVAGGPEVVLTRESVRLLELPERPVTPADAAIVGRLMETDYHDHTFEIHPATGPIIRAHYEDEIEGDIHRYAKQLIRASGWARRDDADRVVHFDVRSVSPIGPPPGADHRPLTVGTAVDPDDLFGGYPDQRDIAEILADLGELQGGASSPRPH
jgi:hypothetical protein